MRVNGDIDQAARLVIVQIIEGVDIDVEIIARAGAQHPVVDEVGPRQRDDGAGGGAFFARQADVERVRIPFDSCLDQQREGVLVPAVDRGGPAFRRLARRRGEEVECFPDQGFLLLGRQFKKRLVLHVAVAFDQMAGFRQLLEHVGVKLRRAAAAEERGAHLRSIEDANQAPDAFLAAVFAPLNAAAVDQSRFERGRTREIARRFLVGPSLEQDADDHGGAASARPTRCGCLHNLLNPCRYIASLRRLHPFSTGQRPVVKERFRRRRLYRGSAIGDALAEKNFRAVLR